jgi:hypothetical protein
MYLHLFDIPLISPLVSRPCEPQSQVQSLVAHSSSCYQDDSRLNPPCIVSRAHSSYLSSPSYQFLLPIFLLLNLFYPHNYLLLSISLFPLPPSVFLCLSLPRNSLNNQAVTSVSLYSEFSPFVLSFLIHRESRIFFGIVLALFATSPCGAFVRWCQ